MISDEKNLNFFDITQFLIILVIVNCLFRPLKVGNFIFGVFSLFLFLIFFAQY